MECEYCGNNRFAMCPGEPPRPFSGSCGQLYCITCGQAADKKPKCPCDNEDCSLIFENAAT
jgi:hypothetical protein